MGRSQSKQVTQPTSKNEKIRFALLGNSGSGKSCFINAIRGLDDDDDDAAPEGVIDTMKEPTEYYHPASTMVSFVELPGIGTPRYPDVSTFCKNVGLEDYDIFLLLTSGRFTENDLQLAMRAKSSGKFFFLIRTKIDLDYRVGHLNDRLFNEEKMFQTIRKDIMENMRGLISSVDEIFLISNFYKDKWDFSRLVAAISVVLPEAEGDCLIHSLSKITDETDTEEEDEKEQTEAPEHIANITDLTEEYLADTDLTEEYLADTDLTEKYLADTREYVDQNGVSGIGEFLRKKLDKWKMVKIRFGITGDSGTGKSTFINAIRDLADDDYANRAAEVGVIESTLEPTEYEYPDNKMVRLVDLPGIGTPKFPDLPTYCKKVGLEKYDTFLIFTTTRFTKNDLELAKEVKSLGKSFFLVRTKIDVDLMPKNRKAPINEEATLQQIREDCMENLNDLISSEKEIFLIANYDKEKWDFDRLVKAIGDALPVLQREVLLLSLSNLTRGCITRKARILRARAVAVAVASAWEGAVSENRAVLDAKLIKETIADYYRRLGLHDITSDNFGQFDKFEEVLRRYSFQSDEELILPLESEAPGARMVQSVSKYIPILGTAVAGSISFVLTLRYVNRCVNELEQVALAVWDEAAERSLHDS